MEKMLLLEKKRNQAADQFYRSRSLSSCFLKWVCQYKIARDRKIIERQHLRRRDMMSHFIEKMKQQQQKEVQQEENSCQNHVKTKSNSSNSTPSSRNSNSSNNSNNSSGGGGSGSEKISVPRKENSLHANTHTSSSTSPPQVLPLSNQSLPNIDLEREMSSKQQQQDTLQIKEEQQLVLPPSSLPPNTSNHSEDNGLTNPNDDDDNGNEWTSIQHVSQEQTTIPHQTFVKKKTSHPSTPSFLKAMEERMNERKERWKQLQEKYKLQEESKEVSSI